MELWCTKGGVMVEEEGKMRGESLVKKGKFRKEAEGIRSKTGKFDRGRS